MVNGIIYECTSGFSVKNSSNTRYMVTAGHCFTSGQVFDPAGNSFGNVFNRKFPNPDLELLSGSTYSRYIYVGDLVGTGLPVISAGNPTVGSSYCVSGSFTGTTCSHVVQQLNDQYCDASGCTNDLVRYTGGPNLQDGDSGAPFYLSSGGYAYIRGSVVAVDADGHYVHKWSTIANTYSVSIVTN